MKPYERAERIRMGLKITGLSQREFSKLINRSHNTVSDWLLPLRTNKEEYERLINEEGHTAIYRGLRNTRKVPEQLFAEIINHSLRETIKKINSYINKHDKITLWNSETESLIHKNHDVLNRLSMHIDKQKNKLEIKNHIPEELKKIPKLTA